MATPKFYGGDQGVAIFCYYQKHDKLPQAVIFATIGNENATIGYVICCNGHDEICGGDGGVVIFCCNRQHEKLQPVSRLATPGKTRRRLKQIVVAAVTVDMNGCSDSCHRS